MYAIMFFAGVIVGCLLTTLIIVNWIIDKEGNYK